MNTISKHKFLSIILIIIATLGATSCSSTKKTTAAHTAGWHDLQMPLKVSLNKPIDISLSGRATMVRDSVINISMRVFGFEVAVAHITADSVFFVDKHNKKYFAEPLSSITANYPLTIGKIQNLILGRDVTSPVTFRNPSSGKDVVITLENFVTTLAGKIASDINIFAPLFSSDISASLQWSVNSAKFNTYPQPAFRMPGKNYSRITPRQIKSLFNSGMF